MARVKTTGNYSKTINSLTKIINYDPEQVLHQYGKKGVDILRGATPKDTGNLANSWYYEIKRVGKKKWTLAWCNSDTTWYGYPVALLVQDGHVSRAGSWTSGKDYVNPAMVPILKELELRLWRDVVKK